MQRLEVSCAVRPIYGSLGAKGLSIVTDNKVWLETNVTTWCKILNVYEEHKNIASCNFCVKWKQ
jgi:hypothetical protein